MYPYFTHSIQHIRLSYSYEYCTAPNLVNSQPPTYSIELGFGRIGSQRASFRDRCQVEIHGRGAFIIDRVNLRALSLTYSVLVPRLGKAGDALVALSLDFRQLPSSKGI